MKKYVKGFIVGGILSGCAHLAVAASITNAEINQAVKFLTSNKILVPNKSNKSVLLNYYSGSGNAILTRHNNAD
jgi:hypothetical protein